jgi:hypothetical protein
MSAHGAAGCSRSFGEKQPIPKALMIPLLMIMLDVFSYGAA